MFEVWSGPVLIQTSDCDRTGLDLSTDSSDFFARFAFSVRYPLKIVDGLRESYKTAAKMSESPSADDFTWNTRPTIIKLVFFKCNAAFWVARPFVDTLSTGPVQSRSAPVRFSGLGPTVRSAREDWTRSGPLRFILLTSLLTFCWVRRTKSHKIAAMDEAFLTC